MRATTSETDWGDHGRLSTGAVVCPQDLLLISLQIDLVFVLKEDHLFAALVLFVPATAFTGQIK